MDATSGNITNLTKVENDPYPFEEFAPTLSQCFVIVIVGYLMAKSGLLRPSDARGVNAFAAYFAMPGIICASLAVADFEDFRWELLVGVFVGKLLTFIVVAGFMLLANGNAGEAGAVAIFCVQSNDLPVGNPLMSSLYRDHRPQMMKYLFFIPAMTIIFFVPVGTIMMNMHRRKRTEDKSPGDSKSKGFFLKHFRWSELLDQARGLVKHPVIISTALGLILNFVFDGQAPAVLLQPISVAAATIPGIALALLGFSFVGKERSLITSSVVPAMGLLFLKMVLTPVLLHTVLKFLTEDSPSSKLLSDFALLYGIISPATGILQSVQEFRKPLAVMSAALILTSFSCFPVSYIVARFTIAPVEKIIGFVPQLKNVLFWTSCCSIFFTVAVWFSMVAKQRWSQFPWCYVTFFAFIQCLVPSGILLWYLTNNEAWTTYCKMFLYHCGEISGYFWTSILALLLIFEEKHEMSTTRKTFLFLSFAVFSVSALISAVMCLLMSQQTALTVYVIGKARSNFEFLQLITTSVILLISLSIVLGCLTRHFFKRRKRIKFLDGGHDNTIFYLRDQDVDLNISFEKNAYDILKQIPKLGESGEAQFYYRDVVKNRASLNNQSSKSKEWKNRLTDLMTIQGLVMSVRFIANLYKLTSSRASEVMIPMEFLQSTLFVGQGMILFLIFGIDIRTVTISIRKWWKDSVYKDCFWGHQLVDWTISEGLCGDAAEAEGLGKMLQAGGVIRDVEGMQPFCDASRLYYFVKRTPTDNSHENEKGANEHKT